MHTEMPKRLAGKPRSFWVGFFLGILTLGVYYAVWAYLVFRELSRQERTSHHRGFFFAAIAFAVAGLYCGLVLALRSDLAAGAVDASLWDAWRAPESVDPVVEAGLVFGLATNLCIIAYLFLGAQALGRAQVRQATPLRVLPGLVAVLLGASQVLGLARWPSGWVFLSLALQMLAFGHLQRELNRYWEHVARAILERSMPAREPAAVPTS